MSVAARVNVSFLQIIKNYRQRGFEFIQQVLDGDSDYLETLTGLDAVC